MRNVGKDGRSEKKVRVENKGRKGEIQETEEDYVII